MTIIDSESHFALIVMKIEFGIYRGEILIFCSISVFYCCFCYRGCYEDDGDESQVLFQRGMEHLRLHHRITVPARAGSRQYLWSIRP